MSEESAEYLEQLKTLLEVGMADEIDKDNDVEESVIDAMACLHSKLTVRPMVPCAQLAEATARAEKAEAARRCADADRNREIERREKAERLLQRQYDLAKGDAENRERREEMIKRLEDEINSVYGRLQEAHEKREVCRWKWVESCQAYISSCWDAGVFSCAKGKIPEKCVCGLPIVEEKE